MTKTELLRLYPNASESFIKANSHPENSRSCAIMERVACHEPLEKNTSEEKATGKFHIRFESCRKRLLDPDNVSVKWTLDSFRYAGVIRGDDPQTITLEICQRKTAKGEAEHTVVTIFESR